MAFDTLVIALHNNNGIKSEARYDRTHIFNRQTELPR